MSIFRSFERFAKKFDGKVLALTDIELPFELDQAYLKLKNTQTPYFTRLYWKKRKEQGKNLWQIPDDYYP